MFLLSKCIIWDTRNANIEVGSLFTEHTCVGFVPKGSTKNVSLIHYETHLFGALVHLQILHQSQNAALYTFENNTQCCQLNDCYRDKRRCACDAVKTGILKALKNEKMSSITNWSKIVDQTAITSTINNQYTFKHSVAANWRYFGGLNYPTFDRNVMTFISKTIEDPLEIGKIELNVSLFLRANNGH